MAKDLPYFKFNVAEWLNGDITLEKYDVQGVFVNICAFYWHKQGDVTIEWLKQRLTFASNEIDLLLSKGFLLEKNAGSKISIKFLNEQQKDMVELSEVRAAAGRKGGQASVKQKSSKRSGLLKHIEEKRREEIAFASNGFNLDPHNQSWSPARLDWQQKYINGTLTEEEAKNPPE